ncbi:MAG: AAA family ATPase [Planctomycetota bacterium]
MSDELNFNAPQANAAAAFSDDSSERREKIAALLRGRLHWAIIISLILAPLLGFLGYKSVVPMYRSTGGVTVDRDKLLYDMGSADGGRWVSFLKQEQTRLTSHDVAERAMATEEWKKRGEDASPWSKEAFAAAVSYDMDERDRKNNFFKIMFDAPSGKTAGAGNRALLEAYKQDYAIEQENAFQSEITKLKRIISQARNRIENQIGDRRTVLSDADYVQLERRLVYLTNQQLNLKNQLAVVRARIDARNPVGAGISTDPASLLTADPQLATWQAEMEKWKGEKDRLAMLGYGPGHQQVKRVDSQIALLQTRIATRLEQLQSDSDTPLLGDPEYDQLRQQEKQLFALLREVDAQLISLGEKKGEVAKNETEIASEQQIIDKARTKIDQMMIELDQVRDAVTIRGQGAYPNAPFNSGKSKQMAILGGMGGVFVAFGLVMGVGLLDRRLRNAGDARMGLRETRMLGILPTLPENFADPEQSERAAHAVHHIRTLLQISNRGTARVFSITSPAAGSGKSSLSVALGLSFAASESKTLVIDCDLVGAGLTRRVGAVVNRSVESILREDTVLTDDQIDQAVQHARSKAVNLKDALIELGLLTKKDLQRLNRRQADSALGVLDACQGRPFSECVANTGIDNFNVLPIGAAKPQDAGLLSPQAIRSLVARAREEYDIVIVDTGPCLGSLEASMAAAEVDATVLIVSRGDSKAMATKAREHLVSVGANVVGVVFNHAQESDMNSSSFASIVSQERRTDPAQSLLNADPAAAARFGPLGSAVAAFGTPSRSPNGRPRRAAAANGSAVNGNGH